MSYFDYVGKKWEEKALWQQLCPLCTHMCAPSTTATGFGQQRLAEAKLHCESGRQKSLLKKKIVFEIKAWRQGKEGEEQIPPVWGNA